MSSDYSTNNVPEFGADDVQTIQPAPEFHVASASEDYSTPVEVHPYGEGRVELHIGDEMAIVRVASLTEALRRALEVEA